MAEKEKTTQKGTKRRKTGTNETGTASPLYCYNAQDWRLDDDFDLAPQEDDESAPE